MTTVDSSIGADSIGFCHPTGLRGHGPVDADVMIVGLGPAMDEMRTRRYYTGETGKLMQAILRYTDVDYDKCYVTNLSCHYIRNPKAKLEDLSECFPRLVREVLTVKPKVILALGALPIQFFANVKGSTKQVRGSCIWNADFNCWIVTSWQPTVVLTVSAGLVSDLVRDFRKINYIMDKPSNLGDVAYSVVQTPVQAQSVLDADWVRVAEFTSLDVECKWDAVHEQWTTDIRCLSISDGDKTVVFPEHVLEGLRWPVDRSVPWTFHNAQFDTSIMMTDQGVELPIVEDTMLMSYSLDERGGSDDEAAGVDIAVGIHGLKRLSREYCGAGMYQVDLKNAPDEVVWEYNAKDAAYTARLAKLFKARQLEEEVRQPYAELILPEVKVVRDEKRHGVYVHKPTLTGLATTWLEEWLTLDAELTAEAVAYGWPEPNFNSNSPPQMLRFLNNYLDIRVDNTRADTLEPYANHPWIAKRLRIKKIGKQLGTYVIATQKVIDHNSRVHPDASLHATVSGRKSYHNPPVGTVPTGGQYADPDEEPDEETLAEIAEFSQVRALFGAPPGRVFIEADYASAELWTAAFLSRDDTMLTELESGDFHSRAAEGMFKVKQSDYDPSQWKNMRRESKYVTFGVLYFREAFSLYQPKPGQGGNLGKSGYTLRQLEEMVRAWHEKYWLHLDWAMRGYDQAKKDGFQRALSGRLRRYHAPGVYKNFLNMTSNWPVQVTAHDHLVAARLEWASEPRPAEMLWDGHDAIYFECDEDKVDEACEMIKQVMERPRWFDRGLLVDIKVGPNWAKGHGWPSEKGVSWQDNLAMERAKMVLA